MLPQQLTLFLVLAITILQIAMINTSRFSNLTQRQPDYQGFLIDVDHQILKKTSIKQPQGAPKIGTFRVNTSNYQKRSLNEKDGGSYIYFPSISLDKAFTNISATELRIQDYYLLRTATPNSELYRLIPSVSANSFGNAPINKDLLKAIHLKQPNFAQGISELPVKNLTAANQFGAYQTPVDRLLIIKKPEPQITVNQLVHSINTLQKNSFAINQPNKPPEKQLSEMMDPQQGLFPVQNMQPRTETQLNYMLLNQNSNALDIFLQFFAKQLKNSYDRKQSIYPMVEAYLNKCFVINQRAQEIKMTYLHDLKANAHTPPEETARICKKYAECMQIKKLIEGFQRELQGKIARNQPDGNMLQYSYDILNILQEIYNARIKQLYRYSHDQITEESLSKIGEALYQQESALLFKYQNTARHNTEISNIPITYQRQLQTIQTPLHINKSYIDYQALEKEQLQNQIFYMHSLNKHLQSLYQREKLEREEHLYDIVNKYEENEESDYYSWQRSKKKRITEIVFIQDQSPSDQLPFLSSDKKRTSKDPSLRVSQFSLNGCQSYWIIIFTVEVLWENDCKGQQLFKKLKGKFKISQKQSSQSVHEYLRKLLLIHYKRLVKQDAKFKFGQLKKRQKTRHIFQIGITVLQQKINIDASYTAQAQFQQKDKKGVRLTKLIIRNEFGEIRWKQPINIQTLDFMRDAFEIGNNAVQCECECLNVPCLITFYQFSSYLIRLEKKYIREAIESRMKKYIETFPNYRLVSIDWTRRRYTISSEEFFISSEEDQARQKYEAQQSQELLKELEQRFRIRDVQIEDQCQKAKQ